MFDFKNDFKNAITNVVAVVMAILAAIQLYLGSVPVDGKIEWIPLLLTIGGAIVAFFTGRKVPPAQ
jgi:hypothetical protein